MEPSRRELLEAGLAALLLPACALAQQPPAPAGPAPAPPVPEGRTDNRPPGAGSSREQAATAEQAGTIVHALILSQTYQDRKGFALPNTGRDAALMADAFRRLRFEKVATVSDAGRDRALAELTTFLGGVGPDKTALLYLAGHGIEVGGENLFMLADTVSFLSLQALVELLQYRAGVTILFLDACRNNPYYGAAPAGQVSRAVSLRSGLGGSRIALETVDMESLRAGRAGAAQRLAAFTLAGSNVKIVFSTDPGNFALDGARPSSRNGPFALALAKRIRQPVSLDDVVSLTTGDVRTATRRRQSPWSQGSVDHPIFLSPRRRRAAPAGKIGTRL